MRPKTRILTWCSIVLLCFVNAGWNSLTRVLNESKKVTDHFDVYFLDKTMRVDYFHSGGSGIEIFSLDQIVSDGSWPEAGHD